MSATTRSMRPGEQHGREYYFISAEEFKTRIENGDFIEYEEVYPGVFYGTLVEEVKRIWAKGHCVVFDVDVVGGQNLKEMFGEDALLMFIKLPDFETLEKRLRSRSTETAGQLETRLEKARLEMEYEQFADISVLNDSLDHAKEQALEVVKRFLNK